MIAIGYAASKQPMNPNTMCVFSLNGLPSSNVPFFGGVSVSFLKK